jgi:hypothetical protein
LRDLPRLDVVVIFVFFVIVVVLIEIVLVIDFVVVVVVELVRQREARREGSDCQNHEVVSAGFTFSRFGGGYVVQK